MGTAYKYIERQAEDRINWAEVGANFSNSLKEENRLREEKKSALDESAREYMKVVNDVSSGENPLFNEYTLDAANMLKESSLINQTLLRSGQLDPRQYTIIQQNMSDGTDQAFSAFENYNREYARKMAMNNVNLPVGEQASYQQNWMMEQVEGMGNFLDTKLVINPANGIMSMAKMISDPKYKGTGTAPLIPDMNKLMAVQSIENYIKRDVTKADVPASVKGYVSSLGKEKRVVIDRLGSTYGAAIFRTVTDITAREKGSYESMSDQELKEVSKRTGVPIDDLKSIDLFTEGQHNWANGLLADPEAGLSILMDFKGGQAPDGEQYTVERDTPAAREARDAKDGSGKNIIIMKSKNGLLVPDLTEDQLADAERAITTQLMLGLDYEDSIKVEKTQYEPTPIPVDERKRRADLKVLQSGQKLWNQLKSAPKKDRGPILTALVSTAYNKENSLLAIVPSDDGTTMEFIYSDDRASMIIEIDPTVSDEKWAGQGFEVTGLSTVADAMAAGGFSVGEDGMPLPYNTDYEGVGGAHRKGNEKRFDLEFNEWTGKMFPDVNGEPFLDQKQGAVAKALNNSALSRYGLVAKATGIAFGDNTAVTVRGWEGTKDFPKTFELDSDIDLNSNANKEINRFQKWLKVALKDQIAQLARAEDFTGKRQVAEFGPCIDNFKVHYRTGDKVKCEEDSSKEEEYDISYMQ